MSRLAPWLLLCLLPACHTATPGVEESEATHPKGTTVRWLKRVDADGTTPHGAIRRMVAQRDRLLAATPANAKNVLTNWNWIGPGNVGGRIRSIAIHPTQTNTMWIGSASGGIWKTTNGGVSWAPLDGFGSFMAASCLVLDPTNANKLWAGTGEGGFFDSPTGSSNLAAPLGNGIHVTTNGGTTWSVLQSTENKDFQAVNRLVVDPNNSNVLLAATWTGIFRSTDGGTTWSIRHTGPVLDIDFHPTDSKQAIAGARDGYPMYSTDSGLTWRNATGLASQQRVEVAYARSNPTTTYATVSQSNRIATYRSTDSGKTYSRQGTTTVNTWSRYNNILWVDPTNPSVLVLGGVYLYRSTNGGLNYGRMNGPHADHHALVEHPGYNGSTNQTLFNGTDGGIYRSTNIRSSSTPSWQELNNNLGLTQFYGLAMSPSGNVVAGCQDNGSQLYTGNKEGWRRVLGGDGGYCAADPTDSRYMYAEIYWIRLYRSSNGGSNFSSIATSSNIRDQGSNFMPPFVLDPSDAKRMYFGGASLWRTNDVRTPTQPTWTEVKRPLSCPLADGGNAHFAIDPPCNICAITVAKSNSNVAWVGHNHGQVWMTRNALAASPTWKRVDTAAMPSRWVGRIAIDEHDADRVYVGFMGYHSDNLWRTLDGGTTWLEITGSGSTALPSAPITSIALHRKIPGLVFVGTDLGLLWSTNDGRRWRSSLKAMRTSPVEELLWKDDDTLVVGTHGRGGYTVDTIDTAGTRGVGTGCGKGPPKLVVSEPVIAQSWLWASRAAPASAPTIILLNAGRAAAVSLGACKLQPALTGLLALPAGTTRGSGDWNASLPVPNDRSLVGFLLTGQSFVIKSGGALLGIGELSNGVESRIGL